MHPVAQVAAGIAGLVHVLFFFLESLWFTKPAVYRRFMLSSHDAAIIRPMAFNQGVYNFALAVGTISGLVAVNTEAATVGRTLIVFTSGCMTLAALALMVTDRRFAGAALVQGGPPVVVLATAFL